MPTTKAKGHWPKNKRRNPEPPDWARLRKAMDVAAERGQCATIARKLEVGIDTIRRWRRGTDLPSPAKVRPLIAALYALHLYFERPGRI